MDQCCGLTGPIDKESLLKIQSSKTLSITQANSIIAILINYEIAYLEGASILESVYQCKLVWPEAWNMFEV